MRASVCSVPDFRVPPVSHLAHASEVSAPVPVAFHSHTSDLSLVTTRQLHRRASDPSLEGVSRSKGHFDFPFLRVLELMR